MTNCSSAGYASSSARHTENNCTIPVIILINSLYNKGFKKLSHQHFINYIQYVIIDFSFLICFIFLFILFFGTLFSCVCRASSAQLNDSPKRLFLLFQLIHSHPLSACHSLCPCPSPAPLKVSFAIIERGVRFKCHRRPQDKKGKGESEEEGARASPAIVSETSKEEREEGIKGMLIGQQRRLVYVRKVWLCVTLNFFGIIIM